MEREPRSAGTRDWVLMASLWFCEQPGLAAVAPRAAPPAAHPPRLRARALAYYAPRQRDFSPLPPPAADSPSVRCEAVLPLPPVASNWPHWPSNADTSCPVPTVLQDHSTNIFNTADTELAKATA